MPIPTSPGLAPLLGANTGAEVANIAASTGPQLRALMANVAPTQGMLYATKTAGALAAPIASTILTTGLSLLGLFVGFKGIQMAVTGKNSFKQSALA